MASQNPAHGGGEMVDDHVGRDPWLQRFGVAVAGAHQHARRADRAREADVHPFVADHERARRIETERACGAVDEAGPRLAAIAVERVLRDAALGVMRTIVDRKSTRLNSSYMSISYAVFCLKKKK